MLTINHDQLVAEVEAHISANAVVQKEYWDGTRGGFIGCLAHSDNVTAIEKRFGLPSPMVTICDHIFERLSPNDAVAFFAAFPDAVGRDGKDLSRIHWKFLALELRSMPVLPDEVQIFTANVIEGIESLAACHDLPVFSAAKSAFNYRVRHAASSARSAYFAAVDAARAAYSKYVDAIRIEDHDDMVFVAHDTARSAERAAHTAALVTHYVKIAKGNDADNADAARAAAYGAVIIRQRDTILQLIREAQ